MEEGFAAGLDFTCSDTATCQHLPMEPADWPILLKRPRLGNILPCSWLQTFILSLFLWAWGSNAGLVVWQIGSWVVEQTRDSRASQFLV